MTSFVGFDLNGFAQQDGLVFYTKYSSANFGDNGKPVSISQQVSNLNIGTRYRLQFFQACEDGFLRPAGKVPPLCSNLFLINQSSAFIYVMLTIISTDSCPR